MGALSEVLALCVEAGIDGCRFRPRQGARSRCATRPRCAAARLQDVVRAISAKKEEPEWLLDFR